MRKSNDNRTIILSENLLRYKNVLKLSDRNKALTEDYVNGMSYTSLGRKYGVSTSRAAQIVFNYIRHAHIYQKKVKIYKEKPN